MLSLKNIVVHYGGVQALKGVSIAAEEGTITCLIGANGAGKSTTLRAISGMVPLTSGEIWFQGRRIDGLEPEEIVELGIAHVPEGKKLFLEMTVRDNLMTGAYLRRDKRRLEQDLKHVCNYFPVLGTAINRPASDMSGGEQQMLAIGRGLMCAPKFLLLDEPSLGLSPIMTKEVGRIIGRIAEEGVTILLIEQNANLALQLAKKCYVLETGSVVLEGDSAELQNNEHVRAAYLGISAAESLDSRDAGGVEPAGIEPGSEKPVAQTFELDTPSRNERDYKTGSGAAGELKPAEYGRQQREILPPLEWGAARKQWGSTGTGREPKPSDSPEPARRRSPRGVSPPVVKKIFTPKKD